MSVSHFAFLYVANKTVQLQFLISHVGFSSICKQLSLLVRISRNGLQATVHILSLVVRLPGNAGRWMNAAYMALSLLEAPLSQSLSVWTPPTSTLSLSFLFCILIDEAKAHYKPLSCQMNYQ